MPSGSSGGELLLLRHAQAEPAAIDAADFARELTAAGRRQAADAAAQLLREGVRPQRLLYSPARRSAETALIIAGALALDAGAQHAVPELYLAVPERLGAVIRALHGGARRLLVVGHNPGLSELGAALAPAHADSSLPTGGYWRIALDPAAWQRLVGGDHSTVQKQ